MTAVTNHPALAMLSSSLVEGQASIGYQQQPNQAALFNIQQYSGGTNANQGEFQVPNQDVTSLSKSVDQPIQNEDAHYYGSASLIPAEVDHEQRVDSNQYVSSPKEYPTAENQMVYKQPLNQEMMAE